MLPRYGWLCFLLVPLLAPVCRAHRLEPISTHFARPFPRGTGSLEINYEYERRPHERIRTHVIPSVEFEIGLGRKMQLSLEMPLIREKQSNEPALVGAGHLELGFRYLLVGGESRSYAVSINSFVAPPTGNRRIAGDATEAGLALHVDKEFGKRVLFHGNYGWSTSLGGSEQRERLFFHRSAVVLPATLRWNPTLEVLGETNTARGHSEVVLQPGVICYLNRHWELKLAVPVGVPPSRAGIGVLGQIAWIFGRKGSD